MGSVFGCLEEMALGPQVGLQECRHCYCCRHFHAGSRQRLPKDPAPLRAHPSSVHAAKASPEQRGRHVPKAFVLKVC